jgi:hypothetical protein
VRTRKSVHPYTARLLTLPARKRAPQEPIFTSDSWQFLSHCGIAVLLSDATNEVVLTIDPRLLCTWMSAHEPLAVRVLVRPMAVSKKAVLLSVK